MGLYEDLLGRVRAIPNSTGFPELLPKEEDWNAHPMDTTWDTMFPPHKRGAVVAPDATHPAVRRAINASPVGPAIPSQYMNAGMLPPLDDPTANLPMNPEARDMMKLVGVDAPAERVPLPTARPADAPHPVAEGDPAATAAAVAEPTSTDLGSINRPRAPQPRVITSPAQQAAPMAAPQAPQASPLEGPSILDRFTGALGRNSNTLLALGAGLAGAPNIGQGISRAAAAAIPARAADIQQNLQQQGLGSITRALVEAGVPVQQAIAAQYSPKMQDALITSYITDRGKDIKMIKTKDPWGGETEVPYVVNKFPREGEPIMTPAFKGADGAASPVPGVANPGGTAIYAPGINQSNFDHSKVGEEYLGQLSPEIQSDVKAYLAGRSLPTGRQGSAQVVKQIAKKYGDDIGMPADDAAISQRKIWSNSLADTKSGVGLQSKGFKQGLEHFVGLSDNLVKMKLSNGLGLEPLAGLVNSAKNLTTDQQELVHKSDVFGQALSREMGNLFAKNGGGVHEAAETKKHISNSTMSSKAAAGSLEAIDELMQGGLRTLEGRRDELFPQGNAPKASEFNGSKQQAQLAHIRRNIAILKGEAPPEAASTRTAPAAAAPKPGRYEFRNGTLVPVQ